MLWSLLLSVDMVCARGGGDAVASRVTVRMGVRPRCRPLVKETLWALSNFTVAPAAHVALVEGTGLLRRVLAIFLEQTFDIRKEAMYTLANVAHYAPEHLEPLLDRGLTTGAARCYQRC
jgi:hypothetical protein